MSAHQLPTSATQRKDRLYAQLSTNLKRLKKTAARSTDLFEILQADLDAMRIFAGTHAAQFMTVAEELNNRSDESAVDKSKS